MWSMRKHMAQSLHPEGGLASPKSSDSPLHEDVRRRGSTIARVHAPGKSGIVAPGVTFSKGSDICAHVTLSICID